MMGALAVGALLLAGCTTESNGSGGDVVTTETTVAEAQPQPFYTLVEDRERFTEGSNSYNFLSPDGVIGCQIVEQPANGPLPTYGGGCVNGEVDDPRGPTVMLGLPEDDQFGYLMEDGGYPGFFYGGGPRLQPGDVVEMGTTSCFVPDETSLGCVTLETQKGFLISGPEVRHFDAADYPEIFDNNGIMEIISSHARIQFDNGGEAICFASAERARYSCGDATGLDFPDMEGATVQSNAVFFDVSGSQPVIGGHNASNVGLAGLNAQPTPPGTYHHHGFTIDHDGHRATFTTPQGGTFWVGVDGFGVN